MAAHSSVLAWRIPGTGKLGGLPSVGLHRVGHDWSDLAAAAAAAEDMISSFCFKISILISPFKQTKQSKPISATPQPGIKLVLFSIGWIAFLVKYLPLGIWYRNFQVKTFTPWTLFLKYKVYFLKPMSLNNIFTIKQLILF